ncbi:MAG: ferritin-like domain-containing protein, partial [Burkholderia sp.]|nr:ferritin-like domain-containing protein [Burkholderia sp.]
DANFAMTGSGAVGIDLKPRELIDLCLAENDRRMAGYDRRLLRPDTVPALARFARRFVPKD